MNQIANLTVPNLRGLVRQAADQLAKATTAAEVLDARDGASVVYDAAKKAARMAKAKGAHDELVAAAHRAQADALEIEAMAKRRLADEYDAAQDRGEVAKQGRPEKVEGSDLKPTISDLGLSKQDLSEARQFRDAERNEPGVVRRTLNERLDAGQEPNKASVRDAVSKAARQADNDVLRDQHRAALPEVIKQRDAARQQATANRHADMAVHAQALEDRIAELEEAVAVLEKENADLKAENKLYGEMKVQFEQGGFEKVIADKDEEIRVANARKYQESADKASWMKSAKFWKAEAMKLGYSRNAEIDIETGEIING